MAVSMTAQQIYSRGTDKQWWITDHWNSGRILHYSVAAFYICQVETTHFTTVCDTKIKAVWLPKAVCAKRQQLLPLILALNFVKVHLLTVSLLTTMMYNTECLIYPCQISCKSLSSNSAFKMEVASPDPLKDFSSHALGQKETLTKSKFML